MQTTFADFEVSPPFDHGLRIAMVGVDHVGECHRVRSGGRVVLTGFSTTAGPGVDLLLTVHGSAERGSAEPGGSEVALRVAVNGTEVALLSTAHCAGTPAESRVSIPASLLAHDPTDELTFDVEPGADGVFLLWHLLLDPASHPGRSEQARRKIADSGPLHAFRTHRGDAGGDASASGTLWTQLGGLGRAALETLSWHMCDGDRASITFDVTQRTFTGWRVNGRDAVETPYEGEVVGIRRMPRQMPRENRTTVFDAQLYRAGQWTDVTALTIHLDVDDADVPLSAIEWNDQAGAHTEITLSPDGRTFFGCHRPSGQVELLYRGRLSRSDAEFPFAPMELPTPPKYFNESFTTCPVRELTGGSLDAAAVIDTVRSRIQLSPQTADSMATVLRHLLLAHGPATSRPEIARAIVELTPGRASRAVGQLARSLTGGAPDPGTRETVTAPDSYEQVATGIALAVLDDAYTDAAAIMFRDARPFVVAVFAADYAALGLAQRAQALAQLAGLVATTSDHTTAEYALKALLRLDEFEHTLAALRALTDRGLSFALVARPLAAADPRVQPALVDSALRALVANPGFMLNLAPRNVGRDITDVASDVLACGAQYREGVARVLRGLVEDAGLSAAIRWSAAYRLALVDGAEHEQATGILTAQGVYDPEAPPTAPPARTDDQLADALAAVQPVWERIERELAQRFPGFGVRLGGPASLAEVVACEEQLGLQLPVEFVASLLVHREVRFDDLVVGMPNQLDVADLAGYREWLGGEWTSDRAEAPGSPFHTDHGWRDGWVPLEPEQPEHGRALDLDPTPAGHYGQVLGMDHGMPEGVDAPGWLALLERFAADLEQGRYILHTDGYLELKQ